MDRSNIKAEHIKLDETIVTLDPYNSDLNLDIDGSKYGARPLTAEGFAFMWAGARATHGAAKGKFCFEVKILEHLDVSHLPADEPNPHVVRVGVSVENSSLQLGEEPLSYGYGGTGKISVNCQFKDFGENFMAGDCILCAVNFESDPVQIGYAKNGKFLGWAFRVNKSELKGKALFPHVLTKNCTFEVNLGQRQQPYFDLPEPVKMYTFIGCLPLEQRIGGTRCPKEKSDCEMIMMCGLPGAGKSVWATDYSSKHPEKKYNILGTNNIIDKMKVMGLPRKRNYHGRWDVLIQMSTKCLNRLFEIGSKYRRNYILDQTNVYPTAQKRKMRNFEGFKRIAVVVVPIEEEFKRRCDKQERAEGKEIPEHAILEMKANFKLPEVGDTFDDVIFTELQRDDAEKLVIKYNEEGRLAVGPSKKMFKPNDAGGNQGFDTGRGSFSNRGGGFQRGKFDGGRGAQSGFDGNRGGFDSKMNIKDEFDNKGFDRGRGAFGGRGGSMGGRGGFNDRGRGGFNDGGRGGFNDGGRGGFNDGGRGGFGGGRGFDSARGSFGSSRGGFGGSRGSFDGNRGGFGGGRGSFDSNREGFDGGRGSFDSNREYDSGRDGFGGGSSRGSFGGGRGGYGGGRGGYGGGSESFDGGRGSFNGGRGGFNSGRGGFDSNRGFGGGRGSFGGGRGNFGGGRGNYSGGRGGNFSADGGNFDSNRGGFDNPRGDADRSGYNSGRTRFEDEKNARGGHDRGGFGGGRGVRGRGARGGFGSQRGGFESGQGDNRGGFDRKRNYDDGSGGKSGNYDSGDFNDDPSNTYVNFSRGGPRGRGSSVQSSFSGRDYNTGSNQGRYDSSRDSQRESSDFGNQSSSYGGTVSSSYGGNVSSSYGENVSSWTNSNSNVAGSGRNYDQGYGNYGDDNNNNSQSGYNSSSNISSRNASRSFTADSVSIKAEPNQGAEGSNVANSSRASRGSGRPGGRTSRWSAETTEAATYSQTTTITTANSDYSGYTTSVKTEPVDTSAQPQYTAYSSYTQSNLPTQGYSSTSTYGYQPSTLTSTASQQWTAAAAQAPPPPPPPPVSANTDQTQWAQYYQQTQNSQYYSQFYGQPAAATPVAYTPTYGTK